MSRYDLILDKRPRRRPVIRPVEHPLLSFQEIIPHLMKRGFVTRIKWRGLIVLCFGMDNAGWCFSNDCRPLQDRRHSWEPSLDDIQGKDYVVLPYFWNSSRDDFLPFKEQDRFLESLRGKHEFSLAQQTGEIKHTDKNKVAEDLIEMLKYLGAYNDRP